MKQWWSQLQARERLLVSIMSLLIGSFILVRLVWLPIVDGLEKEQQKLERNKALLSYVEQNIAMIKASPKGATSSGSLSTIVNRVAKKQGITIARVQPQANDISVWIDQVGFNQLLTFLELLSLQHGIQVEAIDITEASDAGLVKVRRLQLGKN